MKRRCYAGLAAGLLIALAAGAAEVSFSPARPTFQDEVTIVLSNCTQGGVLHWGVNARGNQWAQAIPAYRPAKSAEDGVATRTKLKGPDSNGVCRVVLGPFSDPGQEVGSVDFAIQWDDKTWDTADGKDYHVPISRGRISFGPEDATLNDGITATVRRGAKKGLLRWGVNAAHGQWQQPDTAYWPAGSVASEDGLAVDSPLPPPNKDGVSVITLGPFNRPEQVVTSLHAAVHWPGATNGATDVWDTDFGRNYNFLIALNDPSAPTLRWLTPTNGESFAGDLSASLLVEPADSVTLWLDGKPMVTLLEGPLDWLFASNALSLGRHTLVASTSRASRPALDMVEVRRIPSLRVAAVPEGTRLGVWTDKSGTLFALFAPGKHFISVVGDFNEWNPLADPMNVSSDGTWWLRKKLPAGTYRYQYLIDGQQLLADPFSHDVTWQDEMGKETHLPERALSVLEVGAKPFAWGDADYVRPPLNQLIIYELCLDDFCPGRGFTGLVERLDYIRGLGVTAIEPLPVTEFAGAWSWGYNPAFHYAPETTYGTPNELKQLISECHRRGIGFIGDMVLNHMDGSSPLAQLYGLDYDASPYFRLFLGDNWGFPDIDQPAEAVKKYTADLLRFWIEEYHTDGFRYDATRWVGWQGYNDWGASWFAWAGKQVDTGTYQIAEHLPSDPDLVNKTEMDSQWHDYFRWRLRDMLRNAKLDQKEFERIMDPKQLGFDDPFGRMVYTESHDEERLPRELQQAGFSLDEALRRSASGLAVVLTAPGVPMLYAGQEIGESTAKVLAQNPLTWSHYGHPLYRALAAQTRALIRLRATHPALRTGHIRFRTKGLPADVAVYERWADGGSVVVAINFGREPGIVNLDLAGPGVWKQILPETADRPAGRAKVTLPPGGSVVFSREDVR